MDTFRYTLNHKVSLMHVGGAMKYSRSTLQFDRAR
jgi:hypothetical protein